MSDNKTKPTDQSVDSFLNSVSFDRQQEARKLIDAMRGITSEQPVMWGPSIIGFGSHHYKYDSGREGDTPVLGFSPRKSAITIYFSEGFENYGSQLKKLGTYKSSVSCLYIDKLDDIDWATLCELLQLSFEAGGERTQKPVTVEEYVSQVPTASKRHFDELRVLVSGMLPDAAEVLSYGIVGYKIDDKRARVYISGWKDHVALYPVPQNTELKNELKPYIKGSGTLWFSLEQPLPKLLIRKVVTSLTKAT